MNVTCPNCGATDSIYMTEDRSVTSFKSRGDILIFNTMDIVVDRCEIQCGECGKVLPNNYEWED